jgi:chromosomal replication initiation ATPase DnaA
MTLQQEGLYDTYLNVKKSYEQIRILVVNAGIIKDDRQHSLISEISPYKVIDLVNNEFSANVYIRSRKQNNAFARKAAAYLLRKHTRLSLNEIAPLLKVKDHTSVIYNNQACRNLMDTEDWYKEKIEALDEELTKYSLYLLKN